MKEEILQSIKKDYLEKKEMREEVTNLFYRVKELEKNTIVQEYLKLREELEDYHYQKIIAETNLDLLLASFRHYLYSIKETNKIYFYLGAYMSDNTYDIIHGSSDIRVSRRDEQAEYCIYKDIENCEELQVPIEKCDEFEKKYSVIIPKGWVSGTDYYDIQREFFQISVEEGQEVACQKILSKRYNKVYR